MLTDEYNFMMDYVSKLSERRQLVTTTYLSVNAALIAAIAFLFKDGNLVSLASELSVLTLLLAGAVACSLWRRLVTHHSTLMSWWYEQLRVLEDSVLDNPKLVTKEYYDLYVNKQGKGPIGITRYETGLAWLFTGIYLVFSVAVLITLVKNLM